MKIVTSTLLATRLCECPSRPMKFVCSVNIFPVGFFRRGFKRVWRVAVRSTLPLRGWTRCVLCEPSAWDSCLSWGRLQTLGSNTTHSSRKDRTMSTAERKHSDDNWSNLNWGFLWQKQVSMTWTSNYIPQYLWDVITCPCPRYMLLTIKSHLYLLLANKSTILATAMIHSTQGQVCFLLWNRHNLIVYICCTIQ